MPGNVDRGIKLAAYRPVRQAIEALRGPSSSWDQLRKLTKHMHQGTDIQMPGSLEHDRAAARPPLLPPTRRRGAPVIHDWGAIERRDAAFCRAFRSAYNRVPSWKERALAQELGDAPHYKSLQRHYRERKSRSI